MMRIPPVLAILLLAACGAPGGQTEAPRTESGAETKAEVAGEIGAIRDSLSRAPARPAPTARGEATDSLFLPDALARLAPVVARVDDCLARGRGWTRECMCPEAQGMYCHVGPGFVALYGDAVPLSPRGWARYADAVDRLALVYAPNGVPSDLGPREFYLGGAFATLSTDPSELGRPWYDVWVCASCD